jgi:hypothetical protein
MNRLSCLQERSGASRESTLRDRVVSRLEHDLVNDAHLLGLGIRVLTGFPPRYLLRLDPQ